MASNISQFIGSENPTPISAKNMLNVEQSQQRKMALGDIKNGPIACEKSPVKNQRKLTFDDMKSGPSAFGKSPIKMDDANITTDKSIESEKASSKYVDYNDVWCNNLALSDADITRWINMLNAARTMPMTPPSPPKFIPFDDEDQEIPCPITQFSPLGPPPPLPDYDDDDDDESEEPRSPPASSSDASVYLSFDDTFELEL